MFVLQWWTCCTAFIIGAMLKKPIEGIIGFICVLCISLAFDVFHFHFLKSKENAEGKFDGIPRLFPMNSEYRPASKIEKIFIIFLFMGYVGVTLFSLSLLPVWNELIWGIVLVILMFGGPMTAIHLLDKQYFPREWKSIFSRHS